MPHRTRRLEPMTSRRAALALATCGGIGYVPRAPGTAGSLAALGAAYGITALHGWSPLWLAPAAVLLSIPAAWSAKMAERHFSRSDPSFVVIDEVVGQWLALASAARDNPLHWILAFALFRVFDVVKPYPIRKFERFSGGWGVVADDAAAGACAMMILAGLRWWLG